jgi:pyruvate dehydrogenase E2 component (dihydrolipoamide acetyltransferase)
VGEGYTATKLSSMRKAIAARMTEAKQTIPHFRLVADIEVDAILDLRKELNARHANARLSLNDMLLKACASALMDVPAVNVQWIEGEIRQFHAADISVVTAVEDGLLTPIIRGAESKTTWQISDEVKELTSRAARKGLRMEEIFGGSFSVSNLGMYGVDEFDAIINPPQCAILAVGQAKPRLLVGENCKPRVAMVLRATLSVDHRVLDGVIGAAFLSALRLRLEQPRDGHF